MPKPPKTVGGWGSAPDPAGGAYDAPPDPLIVRGSLRSRSRFALVRPPATPMYCFGVPLKFQN